MGFDPVDPDFLMVIVEKIHICTRRFNGNYTNWNAQRVETKNISIKNFFMLYSCRFKQWITLQLT